MNKENKFKQLLRKNAFTAKILENYGFKTTVFSIISSLFTLIFAVMNGVSGIRYSSVWFGVLAGYYTVLLLFRGGILIADYIHNKISPEENEIGKWKIYLSSGAFLIILEFAMAAAITQMMLSESKQSGGTIMAITNATYAFYKMGFAIYNLVKARKFDDPVTQTLRNINFADACMSIVSLTVLMVATFDDGTDTSMLYMKAATGFAACAIIIAIATVTIIRSVKKINILKEETANE